MITLIYGSAGTGKSEYIARDTVKALADGKRVILLVPEQQAVAAEQTVTALAEKEGIPTVELETLNFTRLCNRVFRRFGGLCYNYIKKGARKIIMWCALSEVASELLEFGGVTLSDKGSLDTLTAAMTELARYKVSPAALLDASDALEVDGAYPALQKKLHDTALIYSAYKALIHSSYDDSEEDLDRLDDMLHENNFFGGYDVYIDSFNGFTPQQSSILAHILRQADNCTITLGLPPDADEYAPMFDTLRDTNGLVCELAARSGHELKTVALNTPYRYSDGEIPTLYKALWDFSVYNSVISNEPKHISLVECTDAFAECEAAAVDITRLVREGGRYSDNIIIVRSVEPYKGVLDAVFERHGIPLFISAREDISLRPAVRTVMSALSVISDGWRLGDIISCVKTGTMGITPDELDTLELYASQWNISGSRWYNGERWEMNPDGYTDVLTAQGAEILDSVNDIKERIAAALFILRDEFLNGTTVEGGARAVFAFAEHIGLRGFGQDDESIRVWNILMNTLDELVTAAGREKVTASEFLRLFGVMIGEADMGAIPDAVDTVQVGDAANFRAGRAKNVYILGAVDGEFPANISDDGMFSDSDRVTLESYGITLSPASDRRASDELFYFARAMAAVGGNVRVSYHISDGAGKAVRPSAAIDRLRLLIPMLKTEKFADAEPLTLVTTPDASFELTAKYKGGELGEALRELYTEDERFKLRLAALDQPFIDPLNTVSPEIAQKLFGSNIALTQTRIESYVKCGFSYYCGYVLKLAERKSSSFKAMDTGSFIHTVLERFFAQTAKASDAEGKPLELTDDEIEELVDGIIDDYLTAVIKNASHRTNRVISLFNRLKRTSLLLIHNLLDEFKQSKFVPAFFELPIGTGEGAVAPLKIPLPNGGECAVYGIADRVDLYKDGDKAYVRVTDYKTGVKDFSVEDLALGINLQMFLYLFAIWRNQPQLILDRAEVPNGKLLPAGVLYMSAKTPELSCEADASDEYITAEANKALTRRGVLTDDIDVLSAMEEGLGGKYIPVKLKKDGGFSTSLTLSDIDGFGKLMSQITDTLTAISSRLRSGTADASPLKNKRTNACEFCSMKPICRAALK